jgi:proteasome alpha subunit
MAMPIYVPPEQRLKDMADYARRGIARGRPTIVLEYDKGILFVADNVSTHLRKIGELYDRIAFAAVGRFSEFEGLRQAGVRLADIRGYAYGREDVTSRAIANAYSQTLGQVFQQEPKPFEVELCVAEIGEDDDTPNALYHLSFDGTVVNPKGWLAMGGQAEALYEALKGAYVEGWDLDSALRAAVNALRRAGGTPAKANGADGDGGGSRLEVAVLARGIGRRAFRRLSEEDVVARLDKPTEPSGSAST